MLKPHTGWLYILGLGNNKATSEYVCHHISSSVLPCCLSASHVVVPGWEDEDVLIVGYTEEPPRKRRKVTDEGVCLCE